MEIPRKEFYEKIRDFRDSLEARWQDHVPTARELYNILIAPLSEELKKAKANILMFYLDGPPRYIPVATLRDGKRWLAERHAVVVYTEAARERLKDKREVQELGRRRRWGSRRPTPASVTHSTGPCSF
ncbi:MAG: CHAT domain-containing protein [Synergistaceae bacterium]|nr:CHAT domain-containing protein [Synergistaceae bacterium]